MTTSLSTLINIDTRSIRKPLIVNIRRHIKSHKVLPSTLHVHKIFYIQFTSYSRNLKLNCLTT